MLVEHKVALGLATTGLVLLYIKLARHVERETDQQETPYGKLSPQEQADVEVKFKQAQGQLRQINSVLVEGSMEQFTTHEANDVLATGLNHLHRRKLQSNSVPDEPALDIVMRESNDEMRKALTILGRSKSGAGFIQDDILTRPYGRPSSNSRDEMAIECLAEDAIDRCDYPAKGDLLGVVDSLNTQNTEDW